jgi:dipeptidyl aminopeptidase/acylaminoacyl peptidase
VASGPQGLWVINVATGAAREILSSGEDEVGASAWSPDGRWIAFDRNPSNAGLTVPPLGSSQLWVVRPDGSGLRQLTHLTGADDPGAPAWSPDGADSRHLQKPLQLARRDDPRQHSGRLPVSLLWTTTGSPEHLRAVCRKPMRPLKKSTA